MPAQNDNFKPSGIVTLTTDFGLDDPFVGIMKGVIGRHAPDVRVIDLCHQVPSFRAEIAGLWIGLCHRWFPDGSVHVAVVDPGVGTQRDIVCVQTSAYAFLAPDNGLAGEIVTHLSDWAAYRVDIDSLGLDIAAPTFHGRDVFAPVGASLAAAFRRADSLGPRTDALVPSRLPRPARGTERMAGEVLFADHFGNLCTNIPGPLPDSWPDATVRVGAASLRMARTYDMAQPGELVGIFNSFGLLEIAVPRASAMDESDYPPGTPVTLCKCS